MRCLLFLAVVGCNKDNPYYCADHPDQNCAIDAPANHACTASDQCTNAANPVCDPASKTCVPCAGTLTGACGGTTPACSATNTCVACTAHAQCGSLACLGDGSCAAEAQVAYVSAAGSGNACTKTAPCSLLKDAVATNLPYIKVAADGAGRDTSTTTIDGKAVTILADTGAKLDRDGDGAILEVRSANADVKIFDLEISGASGVAGADGIDLVPNGGVPKLSLTRVKVQNNQGLGVSSTGGALTVTQSTFANNSGGGVFVTGGTFKITGNFFFSNVNLAGSVGGISISTAQNAANRLDFNSFNKNQTQDGIGAAIQCFAGSFTARNNVLSGNGTLTNMEQVGGSCGHTYSIVRPGTLPSGAGNISSDPLFVNTTTGDLHLQTGSPAKRAADPTSDLSDVAAKDIDGDTRVSPADVGADEAP